MTKKKSNRRPSSAPSGRSRPSVASKSPAPSPGKKKTERATARAVVARKKQRRQSIVIWASLGIVFVGIVLVSVLGGGNARTGTATAEGWDLPAFGEGAASTDRVALADFRGKPTIVNFFASWCIECDNELPHFSAISSELRDVVNFVGVASSEGGNPLYMPERHGVDWWPLARDIGSSFNGNDLAVALGMRPGSMPLTAFYDADGKLLSTNPGALSEAALRANIAQLYGIES